MWPNVGTIIHMTARIIDGRKTAQKVRLEVSSGVREFTSEHGREPTLCTILVGNNPASETYVSMKRRACAEVGIRSVHDTLPSDTGKHDLLNLVEERAHDDTIDGILVQSPLPPAIDRRTVIAAIPPEKDVDGFHPANIGGVAISMPDAIPPCTPAGIMRLLADHEIPVRGSNALVVGRSPIVGRPMSHLLLKADATVTTAHRHTRDLASHARLADILVVACGVPGLIRGDMVKPGAAVIDVGVTRTEQGLVGDCVFDEVSAVAGWISPVPGGVGPMTVAMLLQSTLLAALLRADRLKRHEQIEHGSD